MSLRSPLFRIATILLVALAMGLASRTSLNVPRRPLAFSGVAFEGGSLWLRDGSLWPRDRGLPVSHAVRLRALACDVSSTCVEAQRSSRQNLLPCVIQALAPDAHPSQGVVQARVGPSLLLARVTARSVIALGLQSGTAAWLQVESVALLQ